VAPLRELHGLRDGRVRGHAPHAQELVHAEAEEVREVGVHAREAAPHAVGEQRVDPPAAAQHAVHELLHPPPVARVEARGAPLERGVEELAGAQVRAHLRGGDARVGDGLPGGGSLPGA
jgi:hypothetical protein